MLPHLIFQENLEIWIFMSNASFLIIGIKFKFKTSYRPHETCVVQLWLVGPSFATSILNM